eukprot:GFUD01002121.1.p1 GENE.GFUD01002121.1~~GFUD01002121.1.p1  ORF type:complete len:340 (+),score=81.30 GFUD01002121.1:77-1096(+)
MAVKYSLESVNFASNLATSLTSLLESSYLCDVTLVCDDGQMSAHKVMLAASSSFFSSVFQMNPHNHPLIYLRGMKMNQLQSVLQFMYTGVTAMEEENVSNFLAVAADLKIGGLMGSQEQQLVLDNQQITAFDPIKEDDSNPEPKQEEVTDNIFVINAEQSKLVEKKVFITKQLISPEKVSTMDPRIPAPTQIQKTCNTINVNNPTVATVLKHRPNITMTNNSPQDKTKTNPRATTSPIKKPISQRKIDFIKSSGERKILTTAPRKPQPIPSVFCPICQTMDNKNSTIKMHMEAKREVQCRACRLFFGNCYTLGKHMKGRCREKKAKDEKQKKDDKQANV